MGDIIGVIVLIPSIFIVFWFAIEIGSAILDSDTILTKLLLLPVGLVAFAIPGLVLTFIWMVLTS